MIICTGRTNNLGKDWLTLTREWKGHGGTRKLGHSSTRRYQEKKTCLTIWHHKNSECSCLDHEDYPWQTQPSKSLTMYYKERYKKLVELVRREYIWCFSYKTKEGGFCWIDCQRTFRPHYTWHLAHQFVRIKFIMTRLRYLTLWGREGGMVKLNGCGRINLAATSKTNWVPGLTEHSSQKSQSL